MLESVLLYAPMTDDGAVRTQALLVGQSWLTARLSVMLDSNQTGVQKQVLRACFGIEGS